MSSALSHKPPHNGEESHQPGSRACLQLAIITQSAALSVLPELAVTHSGHSRSVRAPGRDFRAVKIKPSEQGKKSDRRRSSGTKNHTQIYVSLFSEATTTRAAASGRAIVGVLPSGKLCVQCSEVPRVSLAEEGVQVQKDYTEWKIDPASTARGAGVCVLPSVKNCLSV